MVFNRSKYLRRREGPHGKEAMQGMVAVGSHGGGRLSSPEPYLYSSSVAPKSITVMGPSLGHTMSNIYCLEFFRS